MSEKRIVPIRSNAWLFAGLAVAVVAIVAFVAGFRRPRWGCARSCRWRCAGCRSSSRKVLDHVIDGVIRFAGAAIDARGNGQMLAVYAQRNDDTYQPAEYQAVAGVTGRDRWRGIDDGDDEDWD